MHIGWELEFECPLNHDREAYIMPAANRHWFIKHDGSLANGLEIVSYPMTFEYLYSIRDELAKQFKELQKQNCKSFNTNTCGMHVHVSKDAITNLHLYKILDFFRKNKKFITEASHRKKADLQRWASLNRISKKKVGVPQRPTYHEAMSGRRMSVKYRSVMRLMAEKSAHGMVKYSAINVLPEGTIEFRIFKGTLNPVGFYRNIQFLESIIEWTRNESLRAVTMGSYLEYLLSNAARYRLVVDFVRKKGYVKERKVSKKKKTIHVEF